jgi:hypothetical protein
VGTDVVVIIETQFVSARKLHGKFSAERLHSFTTAEKK